MLKERETKSECKDY